MTTGEILFSFQGRIDRSTFAKYYVGIPLLAGFIIGLADAILDARGELSNILLVLFLLCYLWPFLALQTKRWHDRDKSAWWILVTLIPFIGTLWLLFELCGIEGTPGPNHYGPAPTAATPKQVVTAMHPQGAYSAELLANGSSLTPSVASRLAESRKLHAEGLLSEDEYNRLRQKILSEG